MSSPAVAALIDVWALIQAEYWLFWSWHWRAKGSGFYQLHLLYQRIYEERPAEIDRMAELIAAVGGSDALAPAATLRDVQGFVAAVERAPGADLQKAVATVHAVLKALDAANAAAAEIPFSLGAQNVLAGIADTHLRDLYLLQQQAGGAVVMGRPVAPAAPVAPVAHSGGDLGDLGDLGALHSPGVVYAPRTPAGQQLAGAWRQVGAPDPIGAAGALGDALGLVPDGARHVGTFAKALAAGGLLWGLWGLTRGDDSGR